MRHLKCGIWSSFCKWRCMSVFDTWIHTSPFVLMRFSWGNSWYLFLPVHSHLHPVRRELCSDINLNCGKWCSCLFSCRVNLARLAFERIAQWRHSYCANSRRINRQWPDTSAGQYLSVHCTTYTSDWHKVNISATSGRHASLYHTFDGTDIVSTGCTRAHISPLFLHGMNSKHTLHTLHTLRTSSLFSSVRAQENILQNFAFLSIIFRNCSLHDFLSYFLQENQNFLYKYAGTFWIIRKLNIYVYNIYERGNEPSSSMKF
jgi:hypothetical protein